MFTPHPSFNTTVSKSADTLDSLRAAPFHLGASDIGWVRSVRDAMSTEDKLRQLFILVSPDDDVANVERLMRLRPGGIHRMVGPDLVEAWHATRRALELAEVPPFITGDLEGGGHSFGCVTPLPNQLGLAAAKDVELSAEVVRVIAREGKALGFNWTFTPVCDISAQIASAIVGTRSYGSNIDTIIEQAVTHVRVMQAEGLAATAKHWPGEGFDARDQHLVTTINPLDVEAWENSFGRIYRAMIDDAQVLSVMSAHIALPAWARKMKPDSALEAYMPATLSSALNQGLLREHLGFNGIVVSDATLMAGMGSWATRETLVPQVIESGCDVFLFSRNEEHDYELMLKGLREGRLSEQRLEDAVTRILGLKAALGLHRKSLDERMPPLEQAKATMHSVGHRAVASQAASQSITLIKDVNNVLPLNVGQHRRIVVISEGVRVLVPGVDGTPLTHVFEGLSQRGFVPRAYDPAVPPTPENTDLVLYLLAQESMLTISRIFIDWRSLHEGFLPAMARYWHDIPTVMVSLGHPYYLYDAPRAPTYVNAYSTIEPVQQALVRKLVGEEPFVGASPVDAFCGLPDAHY